MNTFAHLETPLDEAPLFPVEACDKDGGDELSRVRRFRKLFKHAYPHARLVAVTNGTERGMAELNRARSEGAAWGFPDMLAIGSVPFFPVLEWKSGTGHLKQHQIDWMNWLHRQGHRVGVFRKPETALAWLNEQGFA